MIFSTFDTEGKAKFFLSEEKEEQEIRETPHIKHSEQIQYEQQLTQLKKKLSMQAVYLCFFPASFQIMIAYNDIDLNHRIPDWVS